MQCCSAQNKSWSLKKQNTQQSEVTFLYGSWGKGGRYFDTIDWGEWELCSVSHVGRWGETNPVPTEVNAKLPFISVGEVLDPLDRRAEIKGPCETIAGMERESRTRRPVQVEPQPLLRALGSSNGYDLQPACSFCSVCCSFWFNHYESNHLPAVITDTLLSLPDLVNVSR